MNSIKIVFDDLDKNKISINGYKNNELWCLPVNFCLDLLNLINEYSSELSDCFEKEWVIDKEEN